MTIMFFVIIRGPAAVGKSTISKIVAERIGALYISLDEVLSKHNLDIIEGDGISVNNFIKGNEIAMDMIKQLKPKAIVLDGCFYREGQMEHILKNLKGRHFIFTLKAKVDECILRNQERGNPMSKDAIHDVFKLVSKKDYGIIIDTSGKTINQIVEEILGHLPLKMNK
jgi:cytidylate kinase